MSMSHPIRVASLSLIAALAPSKAPDGGNLERIADYILSLHSARQVSSYVQSVSQAAEHPADCRNLLKALPRASDKTDDVMVDGSGVVVAHYHPGDKALEVLDRDAFEDLNQCKPRKPYLALLIQ